VVTRTEHDLLGERDVPDPAYWGIHTARAIENFPISRRTIGGDADLVTSLACVKQAAAEANRELGLLDAGLAEAIVAACEEIRAGALHDQFMVDVIQGGAGTSTNMNANEVIANRALELLGRPRGDYATLHPNEHVNRSQSTNDVYPTAIRLALIARTERLADAMQRLRGAFADKAHEFAGVVKLGRTQLQDAVPMTLGQELGAYGVMLGEDIVRLAEARALLLEINLGATAIGTSITAPAGYPPLVVQRLAALTGRALVAAPDLVEATQDAGAFVQLSSVAKRIAVKLSKTCNDLRLLSSGPFTGFGDLRLPPVQAGSSIMPGKVNPVIPEVVNQIAFEVIGHDVTVTMAAEAGQLQLNAFEPILYLAIAESLDHLAAGCDTLAERCVRGIEANEETLRHRVNSTVAVVTALSPVIGYDAATEFASTALSTGEDVGALVVASGLMDAAGLASILGVAAAPPVA